MPIERTVSPPPLKRQRLSVTDATPTSAGASLAPSIPSRPITDLQPNQLRIFSWNINGIAPFLQKSITSYFTSKSSKRRTRSPSPGSPSASAEEYAPSLRACLRRWKFPHLVTLQEAKIAPGDEGTIARVRAAVRAPAGSTEPGYEAFFALPRDKFNARGFGGKVYGVVLLVKDDVLAGSRDGEPKRATGVDWDLEGRFLKFEMEKEKVVVFGVYSVNGTDNAYRSPATGLIVGTRHDRKRAFHSELRSEAALYEKRGWSVIIAGDLNIARKPIDGFPGIRLGPAHVENRTDFEDKFMTNQEADDPSMIDSF
ncbi:hypothetical protein MMC10_006198 [Thelotrema lepadinum]|nr:hypothetical protein [Thelotrema lepadinum]